MTATAEPAAEPPSGPPSSTQGEISAEMERIGNGHALAQPRLDYPPYRSSLRRHPSRALVAADPEAVERGGPVFGDRDVDPLDADLTIAHRGDPIGERIVIAGRVLDTAGRPVAGQLVEVWQANAAGRYVHQRDQHPAPLDPNFTGTGRCLTGPDGSYRFVTIKPGPYPWRNHQNAWRPAHVHFSLFGTRFTERLITQMYFPGDPLFELDPIWRSITDPDVAARLVAHYDHNLTVAEWATGFRWNVILGGGIFGNGVEER